MRFLIVSDIHSNFEALKSVIDDARGGGGVDRIWQLGDLVGYGPEPGNVIDLLREYDHIGLWETMTWRQSASSALKCSTHTPARPTYGPPGSCPETTWNICAGCRSG